MGDIVVEGRLEKGELLHVMINLSSIISLFKN